MGFVGRGEAGAFVDLLRDVVDVRPGEELRVARDDHLVGGRVPVIGSLGSVRIVGDVHRLHAELRGEALHHRQQVDIAVGRLEDDHAIGLDVLHVERHRLACDEVHGDRVAGECVDAEKIVAPRRLPLEGQAAVAHHQLRFRSGIAQEGELVPRDVDHARADLVENQPVAWLHPCREHARAKADHADGEAAARLDLAQRPEHAPIARGRPEVVRRRVAERGAEELAAVHDGAVIHRAVRHRVGMIGGAHDAIEVALHDAHAARIVVRAAHHEERRHRDHGHAAPQRDVP